MLTLGFAIRLLDETPRFSTPEAIERRLPPVVNNEPHAVDQLTVERPRLKLKASIVNLQTALPAIVQPVSLPSKKMPIDYRSSATTRQL